VFETTLNVPVIGICTPVSAWGTATLFANGNAVFQLLGNVVFPLFLFAARGCARFATRHLCNLDVFWCFYVE
jgi:hypothetical protein